MQVPALTHPVFHTYHLPSCSKAALDSYSAVNETVLFKPSETSELLHQLLLLTTPSVSRLLTRLQGMSYRQLSWACAFSPPVLLSPAFGPHIISRKAHRPLQRSAPARSVTHASLSPAGMLSGIKNILGQVTDQTFRPYTS